MWTRMAMTDISFQDVPKKFRYYAKSLMKISPDIEKIRRETITSADEDSGSSKSDDKCDVIRSPSKRGAPGDKNVLPTPPGSPEETLNWNSSTECKVALIPPSTSNPESLISAIERHRIRDFQFTGDDADNAGAIDLIKKVELPEAAAGAGAGAGATVVEQRTTTLSSHHWRIPSSLSSGAPTFIPEDLENPIIARALASSVPKRQRGEKKPIPCEQKDDKYFERRKRNNQAAKKSRDARKHREDQIAVRANLLEKENAILRAQVSTLRDEANSLRQLLIQKRNNRTQ